jgi:MFS transporter, putative metabolite:H+ symporter
MDITARLERLPVSKFHYKLLLITGLGWAFDAMDTGIISFVLPVLAKEWGLSANQVGFIGSMGLVGMALGAVLSGTLADTYGRKRVFAGTLVVYSIATGLCGIAWDYHSLLFFRFFVGFGLGGQLPVAVTLVSEFSPAGQRGKFLVLLESFWAVGWLLASLVSYLIIPQLGWKIAFLLGAVPALYVFYIWSNVPESIRFLAHKGHLNEAHSLLQSIEKDCGVEPAKEIQYRATDTTAVGFSDLWTGRMLRRTVCLWVLWFCVVYSYYGIFIWLPSLMVGKGYTLIKTFEYVLIMTIAQLPGYFSAAYLVERVGRKATLSSYLALCAVCAYFFGQGGSTTEILFWGSLMSFFNLGAWGVVYTYTPEMYPTRFRATGSGWAAGFGRIGGILAPIVVGKLLVGPAGYTGVFAMFTGVLLLAALNIVFLGEETKGKVLDEI